MTKQDAKSYNVLNLSRFHLNRSRHKLYFRNVYKMSKIVYKLKNYMNSLRSDLISTNKKVLNTLF